MKLTYVLLATFLAWGCKSRTATTESTTANSPFAGKSTLEITGEDADDFFDVLNVSTERHLEDDSGEHVAAKKTYSSPDGKVNIVCELGTKGKNCTIASTASVTKTTVEDASVLEMLLTDRMAQDLYDVLDVQEYGTAAIEPAVYEKAFETSSRDFTIKCTLTKEKKECAIRKAAGSGTISRLLFQD